MVLYPLLFLFVVGFLLVIFLFAPFRIRFLAESKDLEIRGEVDLTLLWDAVGFRFNLVEGFFGVYFFRFCIFEGSMVSKGKKVKRRGGRKKFSFRLEYLVPFFRFVHSLFRSFSVERFYLNLRFGLGDAYDTGIVCGSMYPLLYPFNVFRNVRVRIIPVFDARVVEGRFDFCVGNRVFRFISPVFRLLSELGLKERLVGRVKNVF